MGDEGHIKIFVVRHCTTEYNEKMIYCGTTDIPLSDVGRREAKRLAAISSSYDFDVAYSSPLIRATETARAIIGERGIPVIFDERLKERNFGDHEQTDVARSDGKVCRYSFAVKYPNGESNLQVAARVYGFLDEITDNHDGKNILIVSHGSVCRIIRTYFTDMTDEQFYAYSHRNGTIEEYEI